MSSDPAEPTLIPLEVTTPKRPSRPSHWKRILLLIYRWGVLISIILLMRHHALERLIQGDEPISLQETQQLIPSAKSLEIDTGPRGGLFVFDSEGQEVGYVVRTLPQTAEIIGYAGPTDVLIAFGPPDRVPLPKSYADPQAEPVTREEPTRKLIGIQVRKSWDTKRHIGWVVDDAYYMDFWKGRDWLNLVDVNFYDEYMEGVSGATLSSMGIAKSIQHRVRWSEAKSDKKVELRISHVDIGLWIATGIGVLLCYLKGWQKKKLLWVGLKLAALIYVGFLNGSLLAISLLAGYASRGVAWELAPGLVSLVAVSFLMPAFTRKQVYCHHICPHGAAQQLLSRYMPWKWQPSNPVAEGLKWTPWLLLGIGIGFSILEWPLDLAYLEPFDAYLFRQAAWIPIIIAIVSLIISAFVPMAYCKYGCPTGKLLEFSQLHGRADHWGKNDWAAAALLIMTWGLTQGFDQIQEWVSTPAFLL